MPYVCSGSYALYIHNLHILTLYLGLLHHGIPALFVLQRYMQLMAIIHDYNNGIYDYNGELLRIKLEYKAGI